MITFRLFLVSVCVVTLSISSCGDGKNPVKGEPQTSEFPNRTGMLWKYEVFDSLTMTADTVWVSITEGRIADQPGFLWSTHWSIADVTSERIIDIAGDTIDFTIDTTFIIPPLERFVFPLSLGSQWDISPGPDHSEVIEIKTIVVPAGQFDSSALIQRTWNYDFEGGFDSSLTWIAPDVGVVSRYFYAIRTDGGGLFFVTKNQTWKLIEYDLVEFPLNQFPSATGCQWTYEIVNSWTPDPDTVTVTIAGSLQIPGFDSSKIWLISGSAIQDTHFVSYLGDQVWISEDTIKSALWDWRYEFPLAVGRIWSHSPIAGVPRVTDKTPITTPAGAFPTAFVYSMNNGALNTYWLIDEWLVPGVGVVKRIHSITDFSPTVTRQWTLISYSLK